MTTPLTLSIGQQLADLAEFIRREFQPASPDGLFTLHVFEQARESGPVAGWPAPAAPDAFRSGHAPALAAGGYTLTHANASPPPAAVEAWRTGLERLSSKNPFPADRQAFAFRPVELYGLCLGARAMLAQDTDGFRWLRGVAQRLESMAQTATWNGMLSRVAASMIGANWAGLWPSPGTDLPIDELALLRWMSIGHPSSPAAPDQRAIDTALLSRAVLEPLPQTDLAHASILYQAVRIATHERLTSDLEATWQVGRPAQDAAALITQLCRRFPLFATQIQKRHAKRNTTIKFTDEYDVQDAMHALLRLFFDDVRPEEVTPSYAGTSSRIDFLLKREKVVVEVKMTRSNLKQKEVASQLIEDKERYRTHPDYRTLVCFVYDPGGYIANPTAVEDDVSQDSGGFRVVVIVAPKGP